MKYEDIYPIPIQNATIEITASRIMKEIAIKVMNEDGVLFLHLNSLQAVDVAQDLKRFVEYIGDLK